MACFHTTINKEQSTDTTRYHLDCTWMKWLKELILKEDPCGSYLMKTLHKYSVEILLFSLYIFVKVMWNHTIKGFNVGQSVIKSASPTFVSILLGRGSTIGISVHGPHESSITDPVGRINNWHFNSPCELSIVDPGGGGSVEGTVKCIHVLCSFDIDNRKELVFFQWMYQILV